MQIIEKLLLTDIAEKGHSIGRDPEGRVIFVENALPGDVVDVKIYKKRKGIKFGSPIHFHQKSENWISPFCSHFEYCGGCQWQHLQYQAQLHFKEKLVHDALQRLGKVEVEKYHPILAAPKTSRYRNKLEYTFANKTWLPKEAMDAGESRDQDAAGFYHPGTYDKVINIQTCHLQEEPSNAIRLEAKKIAAQLGISFYDLSKNTGTLRNLVIRTTSLGQTLVIVLFGKSDPKSQKKFLDALLKSVPDITSLHFAINEKLNPSYYDLPIQLHHGKGYVEEQLGHLTFRIGPKSFFQTNTSQAVNLYSQVAKMANLKGTENLYDLYTGIGSIGLFLAHQARQIVGIEEIPDAIKDAEMNSQINGIKNAVFHAGDVKNILKKEFVDRYGAPDVLITDPPRAGMHPDVVKMLIELKSPKLIYVSCKPSTQARDLQELSAVYRVDEVMPVDMFPHTHHVENIAKLSLK